MDQQNDQNNLNFQNEFDIQQSPPSTKYFQKDTELQHSPEQTAQFKKRSYNNQSSQKKNEINCERLSLYFQNNQQKIKEIMMNLSQEKNSINFSNLWELIKQILSLQNIVITWQNENIITSQNYLDIFDEKLRQYARNQYQEDINLLNIEFTIQDVKSLFYFLITRDGLNVNYNNRRNQLLKYSFGADYERKIEQSGDNIKNQIDNTIEKYQKLLGNKSITAIQRKILVETLDKLKQQRKQLQNPSPSLNQSNLKRIKIKKRNQPTNIENCLEIIFNYYCKHSYTTGKNPTFDYIKAETNVLTIAKFMIFCKEFDLISATIKQIDLLEIFKKNSQFSKQMSFAQFKTSLNIISQKMFKNKQSINQLYKYLGIQNQSNFRMKLKSLRIPYLSKNKIQISHLNLKYKFKYMPHGGKFADEIKSIIQEKKKLKTEHQKQKNLDIINSKLARANQVSRLVQENKKMRKRILTNNYNSSKIEKTGYSEMYRDKVSKSRQAARQHDPYRLNNIVQNAKQHIKRISTEDVDEYNNQKLQLFNLIQADQQSQDEFLREHQRLELPHSNKITLTLRKKMNELKDLQDKKFKKNR